MNELSIDRQLDLVANHHSASLEGLVPGQVEVGAVQLRRRADADAIVAPRISCSPLVRYVEGYFLRNVSDGQVADYVKPLRQVALDALAYESHHRVSRDVEEVRR